MERFIREHFEEYKALIKTITAIPAPSGQEGQRAAFILGYLKNLGYEQTYTDEACNVILELNATDSSDLHLYTAHTDTVFPDLTPIPVSEEEGRIKGPGVGDDTANVAAMLFILRYLKEQGKQPNRGLVFAFNTCEEGLGNLAGIKMLMARYGRRITRHISFDGTYDWICNEAVGSKRYRITVRTKGGHSYGDFGEENAIAQAGRLIAGLYTMDVSLLPKKTTYNVGLVEGGTSVNTIAQEVHFLYEYRSDRNTSLAEMKCRTEEVFEKVLKLDKALLEDGARMVSGDTVITVELIGDRPGMGAVDPRLQEKLSKETAERIARYTGLHTPYESGSTDCNIPLSMGIPAICYGVYLGEGQHTREEYVEVDSLEKGFLAALSTVQEEFE